MMKISVVIPTYNREQLVMRAISSVLNQSYKDLELIVVDDGSTDQTEHVISKIDDKRVRYIGIDHQGVSGARNIGIARASGDWVAFLDSDDEWLPAKLELQLELIKMRSDLVLVHGEEIWIRKGRRVNPKKIHKKFGGDIFEKCLPLCLISPSAVIIKKDVLEEMGGFDEDYVVCEDYDLWLKITSLYEVGFIETPIIKKYGGHDDQLSGRYFAMDYYRVKSMDRLLKIRNLSLERKTEVLKEIVKKGEILLAGYLKHDNMKDFDTIEQIVKQAQEVLNG